MANEPLMSDSVDPLHMSGISLFPRTIKSLTEADLPSDCKDLDSVHHFMKYLKVSSPARVLDEAKGIVDGSSELLNSKFAKFAHSLGIDKDALAPKGKEKPHERRPGLGRKRARFSLKPNNSQLPTTLETSLDIDQLQDPEEFFSAFEKLENAKKEIQKQKGATASDLNEANAYTNTHRRRPGILGKSASYKHRFSSVLLETDDILTSSQETETLQQVVQSVSGHKSDEETNVADVELQDIDAVDTEPITNAENKIDDILKELLSTDDKDLDEDGALSLLQERLQIKPIEVGNLSIPEFQGIGRSDFKELVARLPKGRKSVSNMTNLIKQLSGHTPRQFNEAAENPTTTASPTPPRSPFPSVSLLKLRSLQSDQIRNPFSPLNIDLVEHKHRYSGEEGINKQPYQFDGSMSGKSRSDMEDESSRPFGSGMGMHTLESRGSDSLIDDSVDKRLDGQIRDTDARPYECQTDLPGEKNRTTMDCDPASTIETSVLTKDPERQEENPADTFIATQSSGGAHVSADDSSKCGGTWDAHVYSSSQVEVAPSQDADPAEENVQNQSSRSLQSLNQNPLHSDELIASEEKDAATGLSNILSDRARIPETHLSQKQQRKGKRPRIGSRESKLLVLRPSLAAAGTSFESGVRRSKRIKMRPLEYWKGERFLYGRIDKSVKLLGVKCISPSKGDGSLTVKSYVPDKYKEILQKVAHY